MVALLELRFEICPHQGSNQGSLMYKGTSLITHEEGTLRSASPDKFVLVDVSSDFEKPTSVLFGP